MQVVEAVDALHSEFRGVDNLVACNTTRVLKAFQNARLGSHVSMPFDLDHWLYYGILGLLIVSFHVHGFRSWF